MAKKAYIIGNYVYRISNPYVKLNTRGNNFERSELYFRLLKWIEGTGDRFHQAKVFTNFWNNKEFSSTVLNFLKEDLNLIYIKKVNDWLPAEYYSSCFCTDPARELS